MNLKMPSEKWHRILSWPQYVKKWNNIATDSKHTPCFSINNACTPRYCKQPRYVVINSACTPRYCKQPRYVVINSACTPRYCKQPRYVVINSACTPRYCKQPRYVVINSACTRHQGTCNAYQYPQNISKISRPRQQSSLLLIWINFNPSMDKQLHPYKMLARNYLSIQWISNFMQTFYNGWILGMDM